MTIGWGHGCGVCGVLSAGPPGTTPDYSCRCTLARARGGALALGMIGTAVALGLLADVAVTVALSRTSRHRRGAGDLIDALGVEP